MTRYYWGKEMRKDEARAAQDESAVIYDLSGKRVNAPRKGIYIQGGEKKVMH